MTWFMHTSTDSCENRGSASQTGHAAELDSEYIFHIQSHNSRSNHGSLSKGYTKQLMHDSHGNCSRPHHWAALGH